MFGNSVNMYVSKGSVTGRKVANVLYYEGHYSSIYKKDAVILEHKPLRADSIKSANISLMTESLVDFPCLPNKKADPPSVISFSPPGGRKKKNAKLNQQPTLTPETKIKNRFEILSNLTFKQEGYVQTKTEASSSSSSVSSSSSSSSDKAQATKNKPQKLVFNRRVKVREFDERYHGFSDRERFASVRASKATNQKNGEEEEKREVFLHKLGKDRAGESNAINLLMSSDNVKINLTKAENVCTKAKDNPNAKSGVEVIHEIIVNCENTQPSVIHTI